jgi:hypothetical protein
MNFGCLNYFLLLKQMETVLKTGHSIGLAFSPRLTPMGRGGLLTRPMATRWWLNWLVPAGAASAHAAWSPRPESTRWHGWLGLAGDSHAVQAARARRWLPCSVVGGVSTRMVRGGHRARRMVARLTRVVRHR